MRYARFIAIAAFFATLGGCAVVPVEPVVYAAPPPPATIVVRPAYQGHYDYHRYPRRPHRHRYWR